MASATRGEAVPLPGLGSAGSHPSRQVAAGKAAAADPPPAAVPTARVTRRPARPSGKVLSRRRTNATTATDLLG